MTVRLYILTEGSTESRFVNQVLALHLSQYEIIATAPIVTHSKSKKGIFKGGLRIYQQIKSELIDLFRQESKSQNVYFTTMVDLYALPNDFPGYIAAQKISIPCQKVKFLEQEFKNDISHHCFIPYIQLHEFEALLYSDVSKFYVAFSSQPQHLQAFIKKHQPCIPEEINEGENTAPSKRIIQYIPEYEHLKPVAGALIAKAIGLPTMRARCPHFHDWVTTLESLQPSSHANSLSQP